MLNASDRFQAGSYADVRGRLLQRLDAGKIDDHVFELIQAAFNSALAEDRLVLSGAEKRRLLADVLRSVLTDMNMRMAR